MSSRLALRLSRSSLLATSSTRHGLSLSSYATAAARQASGSAASVMPKPAIRLTKASTYATRADAAAEEEALARASGVPPEIVPSSRVLQTENLPVVTETVDSFPSALEASVGGTDWSRSYQGLGAQPFPKEAADILLAPIDPLDVEMKPDGLIYLPEIKYRRALNKAFGPGGWGLAPRSETNVGPKVVSREYALICLGRLVAVARGEQEYFDASGIATAVEACKSNALMRCCKDLGIASELWDPRFIREFKAKHCVEVFAEHTATKKKKKLWRRKDSPKFDYPWKE